MSRITARPGRARVTAKIWTSTMSVDSGPSYMSEEAAQVIWQIKLNDGLPWLAEVTKVRELMTQIMNTEDVATRTTLNALLMMARAELSNVMAALALPVVDTP